MDYEKATDEVINENFKKIKKLEQVIDMQGAMIEGMRRVVAISRMVNTQRPDIRMTHALDDYDKCKIVCAAGNVKSR